MTTELLDERLPTRGLRFYSPLTLGLEMLARPFLPRRPHILMPCMMKSGSTFLAHALAAHAGLRRCRLTPAWTAREQELCELRLSRYNHTAYVAQHHLKYSTWTQELIRRYRLTPVVLVRNLFDVTVSLRDHIRADTLVNPIAWFTPHHLQLSDAELEDAIAQLAMPWFVSFYAGWRQAPNALMVRYEDIIAEPDAVMARILDHAQIATSPEKIATALALARGGQTRMNKGVAGRGAALAPQTKQRILDMLALYPEFAKDPFVTDMRDT